MSKRIEDKQNKQQREHEKEKIKKQLNRQNRSKSQHLESHKYIFNSQNYPAQIGNS